MQMVNMMAGPLVGALIGYVTNYIAVKMLFRPRNPVQIGSFTLPFTPGMIPKRKEDLARAVGSAVEDELFGREEIRTILLSEEIQQAIGQAAGSQVECFLSREDTIGQVLEELTGSEDYAQKKERLIEYLTDRVEQGIQDMDLVGMIVENGIALIREKFDNPMIAMFMNEDMIKAMAVPIGDAVNQYIRTDGREKIAQFAAGELGQLEQRTVKSVAGDETALPKQAAGKVAELYENFVEQHMEQLTGQFHIRETVEKKIREMSNEALEALVLSVMKKELGMIVWLGAVIGFCIGILNIFL